MAKKKYEAVLTSNGSEYKGVGETIYDALSAIPLHFMDLKNKAVVSIKSGNRRFEKLLVLHQARQLLRNPMRRSGWAKQFEELLK